MYEDTLIPVPEEPGCFCARVKGRAGFGQRGRLRPHSALCLWHPHPRLLTGLQERTEVPASLQGLPHHPHFLAEGNCASPPCWWKFELIPSSSYSS